jgi:hypothetical protein
MADLIISSAVLEQDLHDERTTESTDASDA